jgi:5-methylcytosine-specific restriction endonuclease McrA
MNEGFPEYRGRDRFPSSQPKGICRGCRCPIDPKLEPRAQTWHNACKYKYDPFFVKQAVRKRSGEKCEMCGRDCSRKAIHEYERTFEPAPTYHGLGLEYPYDRFKLWSHPEHIAYIKRMKVWRQNIPKPEYDHIVPHSENGLFVLENIRLLCRKCHLKRTAEWHKERKQKRKSPPAVVSNELPIPTSA